MDGQPFMPIVADDPRLDALIKRAKLGREIEARFTYHRPTGTQASRYEIIKAECKRVALELVEMCPESRELSNALTSLDEVMFWANASIARRE